MKIEDVKRNRLFDAADQSVVSARSLPFFSIANISSSPIAPIGGACRRGAGAAAGGRAAVKYEFIRMPDFHRLRRLHRNRAGDSRALQRRGGVYTTRCTSTMMRRSLVGASCGAFPKKRATPRSSPRVTCWSARCITARCSAPAPPWATASPGRSGGGDACAEMPNFILKIIPHVDRHAADLRTGAVLLAGCGAEGGLDRPAALGLFPHALADVARLPVREVVSALHFKVDLTLG